MVLSLSYNFNMNNLSLARKIFNSKKPFVFFHTWTVTKDLLKQAILEQKSMDLDVCVDDAENPYLGHSKEYHEKSGEPYFVTMPLWEAVDTIAKSNIAVMVDCKHFNAWPIIEEVVAKIGPERCLVCAYVFELKFNYSRKEGEPDFITEWSPIEKLRLLKSKFPSVTTTPCSKWLPDDLLISNQYEELLKSIRQTLMDNLSDTVCLGVPDETMSNKWLRYFTAENIIPHVMIDKIDTKKLSEMYIGESDYLEKVSKITILGNKF